MKYRPFDFVDINIGASHYTPATVKDKSNQTYEYWERSLYDRVISRIPLITPKNWEGTPKNLLLYGLVACGYVCVFNTNEYGYTFQLGSVDGKDWYRQPTKFQYTVTTDTTSNSKTIQLHSEGELLMLTSDYHGITDIIEKYAARLSNFDCAIDMSIENSKLAWILGAKNKGVAATLKKLFDKIHRGESLVVYDSIIEDNLSERGDGDPFRFFERSNIKNSYITSDLLRDLQTTINEFDCEIGIPTIPCEKKERMVTDEANSKDEDSKARVSVWFDNLETSIKAIKLLYPDINLYIDTNKINIEGGDDNGNN